MVANFRAAGSADRHESRARRDSVELPIEEPRRIVLIVDDDPQIPPLVETMLRAPLGFAHRRTGRRVLLADA